VNWTNSIDSHDSVTGSHGFISPPPFAMLPRDSPTTSRLRHSTSDFATRMATSRLDRDSATERGLGDRLWTSRLDCRLRDFVTFRLCRLSPLARPIIRPTVPARQWYGRFGSKIAEPTGSRYPALP
jgi:hypothetical protein